MEVPLRRGEVKAVSFREKILFFSDGEVQTAIKLEGTGG